MKPIFQGKSVRVVERGARHTRLCVTGQYEGAWYTALTNISEGQDTCTELEGYAVPPSDEFIAALHDYLTHTHGDLYGQEMQRIVN